MLSIKSQYVLQSLSDHKSQSVKNPLCTLPHSWLESTYLERGEKEGSFAK